MLFSVHKKVRQFISAEPDRYRVAVCRRAVTVISSSIIPLSQIPSVARDHPKVQRKECVWCCHTRLRSFKSQCLSGCRGRKRVEGMLDQSAKALYAFIRNRRARRSATEVHGGMALPVCTCPGRDGV